MDLEELRDNWQRFGAEDPLWAILTHPDKRFGRWDLTEFFGTGKTEIERALALAESELGQRVSRGRAMDFGCGVGRLTQALVDHFDRADGVDIASSMIDEARTLNQHADRCEYHLNDSGDLRAFGDAAVDFIYTAHVLQHMEPRFARGYVGEFLRVLRPGGALVFEITTTRVVGATGPLPSKAFRAEPRVLDAPSQLMAGARAIARVRVTNTSRHTWPAAGENGWYLVNVGNHWSTRDGRRVVIDDGRAALPRDLPKHESVDLDLVITAPDEPGEYTLDIDLCQEGVAWFGDEGVVIERVPVTVTPAPKASTPNRGAADSPVMEMYGTPIDEVTDWVTSAGGRVLRVLEWQDVADQGPDTDWHRHVFVVTR